MIPVNSRMFGTTIVNVRATLDDGTVYYIIKYNQLVVLKQTPIRIHPENISFSHMSSSVLRTMLY